MEAETIPPNGQPIDELHAQTIASSPVPIATETAPLVETVDASQPPPADNPAADSLLCQEVLEQGLEAWSESVQEGIVDTIEPIVGEDEAKEVADLAAMPPHLQKGIATSGTRLAEKYGVTKYISHEGALIAGLFLYWRKVSKAQKRCEAIVEKANKAREAQDKDAEKK